MKIAVCLKVVPDTDTRIRIAADGRSIDPTDVKFIMSPYDEFALEEAIKTKEAKEGEVISFSIGGDEVPIILRDSLARGADSTVHIRGEGIAISDPLIVGKVLAAAIKEQGADIVFFGKHGVGGDNQQVHAVVAERLGMSQITVVTKLEITGTHVRAEREVESGLEVVETTLPVVIAAQRGLNEPRYPKLPAIMQAKKKPFATKTFSDLGFSTSDIDENAASIKIVEMYLPPPRQSGRKMEGDSAVQVHGLIDALKNEAKVI